MTVADACAMGSFNTASAMDYLPLAQLRAVQLERFKAMLTSAYEHVPLFRQRMDEREFKPSDFKTLADTAMLPFTFKSDLRDTYPFGLFATPMSDVVRLHASSGTTGKPIVVAYTKDDLAVWTQAMVRAFAACGLHAGDIVQNAYGYGLFTGGLGAHYGIEALGATVIPVSGGNTDRQLMILKDCGVTALCCTPSYCVHLMERGLELGIDFKKLPLRIGVFGAEPWTEEMRAYIESNSMLKAYDIYGLSELVGPGVGIECSQQSGFHIFEDFFYPEIVDPATGEILPDGVEGELVLTTLAKQAMPMIRYRTRDITSICRTQCECGRTIRRINRISRRSDDMFIIRGINIFPTQVETALLSVDGALPHYQIVLYRDKGLDQMEVQVEVTPACFSDRVGKLEALRARILQSLDQVLGIRVDVRLVEPQTIQRSEGKAKRVLDRRTQASKTGH